MDSELLILSKPLRKVEDNNVEIKLSSALEVSILDRFEIDLVGFLRKNLRNDFINLVKAIDEQQQTKKLYTSQDKYEYMVQQNPAIKDLKDRLGLDFEY